MGWNLEVVAVRTGELDFAIPEIFFPTGTTMDFEDATSVARGSDLCATKVGDWVIVIDVSCRLSGNYGYLVEASASTDLHLVRIFDEPIILHYRDGEQMVAARGLAECLEIAPCDDGDYEDGETCAMKHFRATTGVTFGGEDMWGAKFTPYSL